ncbi:hypothetical protein TTHERM_000684419 (macronuclear) [Tetrahymena thermophila SB210]|uniref:Uncharacterized protein n=1 Tax=Tetrahymena thermophila (strain SB210) TaxID=312017 RepID=W7WXW6_TETTS|nr:hypothetical protein TTHERM_000684419 [Tetrahymena thermophila SB210]EWS71690.1 hypothetical protein TTHERM_000684419 [Tetrahymena thermophila SB210]|eukprot:XP_012655762.1 hypothetical protein TTHERM_000684419 [Tetrahymena thermophila SB210]
MCDRFFEQFHFYSFDQNDYTSLTPGLTEEQHYNSQKKENFQIQNNYQIQNNSDMMIFNQDDQQNAFNEEQNQYQKEMNKKQSKKKQYSHRNTINKISYQVLKLLRELKYKIELEGNIIQKKVESLNVLICILKYNFKDQTDFENIYIQIKKRLKKYFLNIKKDNKNHQLLIDYIINFEYLLKNILNNFNEEIKSNNKYYGITEFQKLKDL